MFPQLDILPDSYSHKRSAVSDSLSSSRFILSFVCLDYDAGGLSIRDSRLRLSALACDSTLPDVCLQASYSLSNLITHILGAYNLNFSPLEGD